MRIYEYEVLSLLMAITLAFFVSQKKNSITVLWALFIYGATHFIFGLGPFISSDSISSDSLHLIGGGLIANISVCLFLGYCFNFLFVKKVKLILNKKIYSTIFLIMSGPIVGYVLNYREGDWAQFKNLISMEALTLFLIAGVRALISNPKMRDAGKIYIFTLIFLIATSFVSIYEVASAKSWASTVQSSGVTVFRASATAFNPNVLGFCASIVFWGASYGWSKYPHLRWKKILPLLFFSGVIIYLSGSRSAWLTLLISLFIPIFLLRSYASCISIIILLGILSLGHLLPLGIVLIENNTLVPYFQRVSLLAIRFVEGIPNFFSYVMVKAQILYYAMNGVIFSAHKLPPEIMVSLDGRFTIDGDSGWGTIYRDMGLLGILSVVWGSFLLIKMGINSYIKRPGLEGAYSLAGLLICILTGFFMKFQIYPIWIFIAVTLTINLYYWNQCLSIFGPERVADAHSNRESIFLS